MKTTHTLIAAVFLAATVMLAGGARAQTVVNGQATFQQLGTVRTITNTPGTIIQWPGFSIPAGEVTRFVQQNAASAVLNRITGQEPSLILGALQSNGRVFLVNPNGVVFGAGSRVDVNGLVASSLAISNSDFLAGKMHFSAGAVAGSVVNQGRISTPGGGQVILMAPQVENNGLIHSPGGNIVLAAGRSVMLADSQNPALHVVVSAPQDQAVNLGQIVAQSGRIGIYGNLVNQRGLVSADQAAVGANGQIVLKASGDLLLEAGSVTSASSAISANTGGTVHLLGERVGLTGNARVEASGQAGGGTVLVGGDYRGQNSAVPNARQVYLSSDAAIRADALASGNGGKVIAWSDGTTRVHGRISARGGAQSGDGGFVEASGHALDMRGRVDTRAPNGRTGTLLLDPTNIYIANDQASATGAGMAGSDTSADTSTYPFVASGPVSDSLLSVATLEAALANSMVTVTTDNTSGTGAGIIRVVDPVTWTSDTGLTLQATAGIEIDAALSGGNGSRLALYTASGNINQTAPISVVALSARADNGSVNLTQRGNMVEQLAGFASGAGGFNYRGNDIPLVIGMVGLEDGITSLGSGPINVDVSGALFLQSPVNSQAGDIALTAASFDSQSTLDSVSGRLTVLGSVLRPSLADCTANAALAGCAVILPTLAVCTAAPSTAGCSAVLPTLATCTAAPSTTGCSVVLPSLAACISSPGTPGCSVVLPTLAVCTATPSTSGCSAVLPALAACTASPGMPGCSVVLPTLATCTAAPATPGCSVVLPTLAFCIATPSTLGCSAVLPNLMTCIATPGRAGCVVILPALSTCTAIPATAGCSVVLPSLAVCVANPSMNGCAAVLPALSQCTIAPATAGCSAVLPTLAQCVASPSLTGCSAVLPSLATCVANPTAQGCATVKPPPSPYSPTEPLAKDVIEAINTDIIVLTTEMDTLVSIDKKDALADFSTKPSGEKDVRKKTYCN